MLQISLTTCPQGVAQSTVPLWQGPMAHQTQVSNGRAIGFELMVQDADRLAQRGEAF